MTVFIILLAVAFAVAFFIAIRRLVIMKKAKKTLSYDEFSKRLTVSARSSAAFEFIHIDPVKVHTLKHEEEQLHYLGVSVGGVSTGGFYKTGGYDYISKSKKTSHYCMNYMLVETTGVKMCRIDSIAFSADLVQAAKQSSIGQYMNDNGVIELYDQEAVKAELELEQMQNPTAFMGDARFFSDNYYAERRQEIAACAYPTQEKCAAIRSWICKK